ncbi:hypothetical protein T492DRAFT_948280 [Pavlovales sp. CCMP2436]|nr:hypothetical protein T492DRAFT_948280 [Pavlovales sp. CCMP2436]
MGGGNSAVRLSLALLCVALRTQAVPPAALLAAGPVTGPACAAKQPDAGLYICEGYVQPGPTWKPAAACKRAKSADRFLSPLSASPLIDESTAVRRSFLMAVPSSYNASIPASLVILCPDTGRSPMDSLLDAALATSQRFGTLLLVLDGVNHAFNVHRDAQPDANGEDDVAYAYAALRYLYSIAACIDPRRIFCAGYSRGGRFCAQLASELSEVIAAIAPVASLRFPMPNNATRPISVIAFHGTKDPINPYDGGGGAYWSTGVLDAYQSWALFNCCATPEPTIYVQKKVAMQQFSNCKESSAVVLFTLEGMGHVWPGPFGYNWVKAVGPPFPAFNANAQINSFFQKHPLPEQFGDAARKALEPPPPPLGSRSARHRRSHSHSRGQLRSEGPAPSTIALAQRQQSQQHVVIAASAASLVLFLVSLESLRRRRALAKPSQRGTISLL